MGLPIDVRNVLCFPVAVSPTGMLQLLSCYKQSGCGKNEPGVVVGETSPTQTKGNAVVGETSVTETKGNVVVGETSPTETKGNAKDFVFVFHSRGRLRSSTGLNVNSPGCKPGEQPVAANNPAGVQCLSDAVLSHIEPLRGSTDIAADSPGWHPGLFIVNSCGVVNIAHPFVKRLL
jgi:hypothetical protein